MLAFAKGKYLRGGSYKTRQVIDLIRGEKADKALMILDNVNKRAVYYVKKVLKSAISNFQQKDKDAKLEDIYISKIVANDGPRLKRFRPRAMGRATQILHRSLHLYVEVKKTSKIEMEA